MVLTVPRSFKQNKDAGRSCKTYPHLSANPLTNTNGQPGWPPQQFVLDTAKRGLWNQCLPVLYLYLMETSLEAADSVLNHIELVGTILATLPMRQRLQCSQISSVFRAANAAPNAFTDVRAVCSLLPVFLHSTDGAWQGV